MSDCPHHRLGQLLLNDAGRGPDAAHSEMMLRPPGDLFVFLPSHGLFTAPQRRRQTPSILLEREALMSL